MWNEHTLFPDRVDDSGAPSFGIMHRRLSFDSKRSRPVFGSQQSCVRQTRSGEEIKVNSFRMISLSGAINCFLTREKMHE